MEEDRLLKVGMVASLTGQFHSQGSQAMEGAKAWARDANAGGGVFVRSAGRRLLVHLQHYDDESKAQVARALTEKLILEDRVDLLLGPYSSVLTLAVAPVAERSRRVLWNHGGASDQIYAQGFRWVVGILTPASRYLLGVIDLVKERDPAARKVAILHSNRGSFPVAVASGAESYALEKGFQVVLNRQYPPGTADFSPLLREMEQSRPDVIIGVGRIQDDLILARQMVDWPIRAKTIALVAAGIRQFKESLGRHATGFLGPSQWEPGASYVPDYGPSPQELAERFEGFRGRGRRLRSGSGVRRRLGGPEVRGGGGNVGQRRSARGSQPFGLHHILRSLQAGPGYGEPDRPLRGNSPVAVWGEGPPLARGDAPGRHDLPQPQFAPDLRGCVIRYGYTSSPSTGED